MAFGFGSGNLFTYRTDIAHATPIQFGALQSVEIDFSFDIKELMGQNQFAIDTARAGGKISGKASTGVLNMLMFNEAFFGQTLTTGQTVVALNEIGTVPAITPWQVTVANGATWVEDRGVTNALTGATLKQVAASPTTGQYSCATGGIYTFATADANLGVRISYTYTVMTGSKLVITNQPLGQTPTLKLTANNQYKGKNWTLELNAVTPSKWNYPTKIADYMISDFEFSAYADAGGIIGTMSCTD